MNNFSLYLMVLLYLIAGILHWVRPSMYLAIMPTWLPFPKFLIWLSGLCEILFGLLLIPLKTRSLAAWLIIVLLIAIFPANVQMALQYGQHRHGWWLTWLRLPLQVVLIWWAYTFTATATPK